MKRSHPERQSGREWRAWYFGSEELAFGWTVVIYNIRSRQGSGAYYFVWSRGCAAGGTC